MEPLTRLSPRALARLVVGLVALVGVIALVGTAVRQPVATFSAGIVAELGLLGMFAAVLAMDPIPGLGFQPALFFGYTGGLPLLSLVFAAWSASLLASAAVWALGRSCRNSTRLVALLDRSRLGGWLREHGVRTIAVAAVAPVPFGLATLGAGVLGVRFRDLLVGASFRGIKIAATAVAIGLGWGVGA